MRGGGGERSACSFPANAKNEARRETSVPAGPRALSEGKKEGTLRRAFSSLAGARHERMPEHALSGETGGTAVRSRKARHLRVTEQQKILFILTI